MAQPIRQTENLPPSGYVDPRDRIQAVPPAVPPYTQATTTSLPARTPDYQTFQILRFAFTVVPLVAGLDKFVNVLANWEAYLSPLVPEITGIDPTRFMQIVGAVEIFAGIGVALMPRFFAWIVGAWLLGIIANLVSTGQYFDIALRDLGLCLSAFALARIASYWNRHRAVT